MFVRLFGFLSQVVFSDGTALARAVRKGVFFISAVSSLEIYEMASLAVTRQKILASAILILLCYV